MAASTESVRLGIDLGGTKIEIAALAADGSELLRRREPSPANDYPTTIATIARLVASAESELGLRATVGIGIPGSESPSSGLIRNANSTCLNGHALRHDIEHALGRTVRIANDANCLAMSEAGDGAGAGFDTVFAVILGTGVGGALAVKGRVLLGANAIAGEWGHNPLPAPRGAELPGPRCYCGRINCIETWLSGPGLAADHARHGGSPASPEAIVAAARAGEAMARASLARYGERLARSLATVINIFDPDAIVLAGGLSNIDELYEDVPRHWGAQVFSDQVDTRLLRSRHGDSSGVRGAAWLWPVAATGLVSGSGPGRGVG